MSSFKEPTTSRPLSHHRVPSSSTPLSVPGRNHSHHRQHAHSVSLGTSHHHANRVTRRKSMTANNLAAVVQHIDDASLEALVSPESRVARRAEPIRPVSGTSQLHGEHDEPHIETELGTDAPRADLAAKGRNRRASESATLSKEGRRVSGELKCDKCGKGYKHSSCLTKHLWEHTPEWAFTSKLLISKHQQVQLLEAASVLVTMNQDLIEELVPARESDNSSASPAASGSSELLDDDSPSSAETTPPPMSEDERVRDPKRYSTASSMYSRSYQSAPGTSIAASSVPSSSYGSYHQRPSSGYVGLPAEDEAGLAAAVKLVHFGTPRSNAQAMDDVPPVPPLPARYASGVHSATPSMSGIEYSDLLPHPLSHRISDERDTKLPSGMASVDVVELENRRSVSRGHSEHEDGFFGRMEE